MVIEKTHTHTHKFHVCRNGVRELLNLERFFPSLSMYMAKLIKL